MSIPYYTLQPGSQKNALTDDARCKYWVSAPPLQQFTGCNYAMKTSACSNQFYYRTKFGRCAGLMISCNRAQTHSSGCHCCCTPYGGKGSMGYRPNTVNVDQCYLTTYSITGPTSNIHMDEFGQTIDSSLRQRSAGSWEPPAACGYTWCNIPICGFNKCTNDGGACYLRLGGSCCGKNVFLCGHNQYLGLLVDKKAGRYPDCNPFVYEECGLSCNGLARYTDIRPLYAIDSVGPARIVACTSLMANYGCHVTCLNMEVYGSDDPLKSHYNACCTCSFYTYCLFINTVGGTIQPLAMCQQIGTAWSMNESTRRMHQWLSTPCGGCSCCFGAGCCTKANVRSAGFLIEHRIPTWDELDSCAICGNTKTGVECLISLPNTIFPQCRTAYDQDRGDLVDYAPTVGGNMYDCIMDEGRYTILNGTTLNARTRCNALMPYPILYDRCTSTVKTFEPFYSCCHNWKTETAANSNRWVCYQTNGFMAKTARNTLVHAWTHDDRLAVKEMNMDGTAIAGSCYNIGGLWHAGARSTTAVDFMYDKNSDSLVMSYMFGDCCCQCTNQNTITCGWTEPVVMKLPTNTCCINSVINEQAHMERECNCTYRSMFVDLPTMCCSRFYSGNCCSLFSNSDCQYCIRTCVIPDIRIFCTTPGCCGGFISQCCIWQRACCCSDGCHGRNATFLSVLCVNSSQCNYVCAGCLSQCSCNITCRSQVEYSGRKSGAAFGQVAFCDTDACQKYRNETHSAGASQYFVNPLDLKTNS